MVFEVEEVAAQLIGALRPLVPRIKARERALADQLTRAASSVLLNIGEGNYSDPGNRRARFFTASGSASEVRSTLRAATEWGHLTESDVATAQLLANRVLSMLWKLTH
jgi:four helix bundle protein